MHAVQPVERDDDAVLDAERRRPTGWCRCRAPRTARRAGDTAGRSRRPRPAVSARTTALGRARNVVRPSDSKAASPADAVTIRATGTTRAIAGSRSVRPTGAMVPAPPAGPCQNVACFPPLSPPPSSLRSRRSPAPTAPLPRHRASARTPNRASCRSSTARRSTAGRAPSRATKSGTARSSARRDRAATSSRRRSTGTSSSGSRSSCRRPATTASRSATRARATRPTSAWPRCRCSTTAIRNTRTSIRARRTARPTAWSPPSAGT